VRWSNKQSVPLTRKYPCGWTNRHPCGWTNRRELPENEQ
jgi:hypothetical protein